MQSYDDSTSERPYSHAVVVGIDKYPRKVTRAMNKNIRPFMETVNCNHVLPTLCVACRHDAMTVDIMCRCFCDIDFAKSFINKEALKEEAAPPRTTISRKPSGEW